jgi:hypothetical protein
MQPASAQTEPGHGGTDGRHVPCARCGRENAADARFCAGCGAALASAQEATAEAADASLDVELFKPLPQRDPQFFYRAAVTSGVAIAVLGAAAYYVYTNFFFADFSPVYTRTMPATEDRTDAGTGPAAAGKVTPAPEAEARPLVPQAETPAIAAESPAMAPRAAVPSPATAGGDAAPSKAPSKAAPPQSAARPAAAAMVKPAAIGAGSCTEAIAAVGLCAAEAKPRARPPAESKSTPAPRPGAVPCEQGVAALGLCVPATNQGKE